MTSRLKIYVSAVLAMLGASLQGCFTGVESTPRISTDDIRRQGAAGVTAEQRFLADVQPVPPAKWQKGKDFRVTDNRISLIFTTQSSSTDSMAGRVLRLEGIAPARSLTGDDASEITFSDSRGGHYYYRIPNLDSAKLDTLARMAIPFTIDMDVVRQIDSRLRGNNYFITTPQWYNATDGSFEAVGGLRHIEVHIDSVGPGNENFPAAVYFTVVDPKLAARVKQGCHALLMSVGQSRAATRNFDTLFAFDNPRKLHPLVTDKAWELIIRSKVENGMSREECRLALGAPAEVLRIPTYGGMAERWSYTDGVFLIFEDGFLSRYRL